MKKSLIIALVSLVVIGSIAVAYIVTSRPSSVIQVISNPKNATYTIDGKRITLKDGVSEIEAAPGSASKITTRYFGNELVVDMNNDGRSDTAFILTQESGGSGSFFYAVAAINTVDGYVGSDAYLLGDRVAPQSTNISPNPKHKNVVVFNYADRAVGDSMTTQPSVGKSVYLKLDTETMKWGVVVPDFEGEADPAKMSLTMKTWDWVNTTYSNGSSTTPKLPNKFTLTFTAPNRISVKTDCNGMGGEYVVNGSKITFGQMMSTLMYCEGSQEQGFAKSLSEVQSYFFTSKGELVFDLKFDSGSMVFK